MNRFAQLKKLESFQFKKVKFYSILFEGEDVNEFFGFLNRMEDEADYEDDLDKLIVWLEKIGEVYGAQKRFFRNEAKISDVSALPPPHAIMKSYDIEVNQVRLYCYVISETVVVLFNGGIKTSHYPQDCPNVRKYFNQANLLGKKLLDSFLQGDIVLNESYSDIIFSHDLEFEINE